ncbi:hypothetical protein AAFF_G00094390 [Aldrovandia affinis]|uniref:Uncharacterized protein n=1 Tax=Aldrovandia affinis TaxID=143900 RepID=A0AAD7WYB1_9TELE|nr:hypothetical protein AAFF_G00094390 [Aldrovandia affinis]
MSKPPGARFQRSPRKNLLSVNRGPPSVSWAPDSCLSVAGAPQITGNPISCRKVLGPAERCLPDVPLMRSGDDGSHGQLNDPGGEEEEGRPD